MCHSWNEAYQIDLFKGGLQSVHNQNVQCLKHPSSYPPTLKNYRKCHLRAHTLSPRTKRPKTKHPKWKHPKPKRPKTKHPNGSDAIRASKDKSSKNESSRNTISNSHNLQKGHLREHWKRPRPMHPKTDRPKEYESKIGDAECRQGPPIGILDEVFLDVSYLDALKTPCGSVFGGYERWTLCFWTFLLSFWMIW